MQRGDRVSKTIESLRKIYYDGVRGRTKLFDVSLGRDYTSAEGEQVARELHEARGGWRGLERRPNTATMADIPGN